jgi:hypothetical protein
MSMKNSNDTIENGSRDLTVCSAVPQTLRHRVYASLYHTHLFCVTADIPMIATFPVEIRALVEYTAVTVRFATVAGQGVTSALRYASHLSNRLFVARRSCCSQDDNTL